MADRRKRRKQPRDEVKKQDRDDTKKPPSKRNFRVDSLEQRILMSATWVDAEVEDPGMIEVEGGEESFGETEDGGDNLLDVLGDDTSADTTDLETDASTEIAAGDVAVGDAETLSNRFGQAENATVFEIEGDFPEIEVPTAIGVDGDVASGSDLDGLPRQEIVFIDASVTEADALLAGMAPGVEVIQLDADRDGVEQMAELMEGRSGIDAIHVVSHGQSGELQLGNATLDAESIDGAHADALATIGNALAEDADLMIYGCDFGSGEGADTAAALAEATGADVAASDDATGHESLDGDWDLETSIGSIETDNPFSATAMHEWVDILSMETDDSATLAELADKLEGDGITIANLTVTVGEDNQYGTFTGGADDGGNGDPVIGLQEGMVFTTGTGEGVAGIAAANEGAGDETAQLKDYDTANNVFHDDDRFAATDAIGGSNAAGDGIVIEFDAAVTGGTLGVNFVFASEEYPEWVDQGFNDAFVFMVSGPGIEGEVNIATVPDSGEAITINSVNADTNSDYYVDNRADGANAPFDGWTVPITGEVDVQEGETYHVRMVLADYGDTRFDSAVFVENFFSGDAEADIGAPMAEPDVEPIADVERPADFSYVADLDTASDTGASATDNITTDDTPTFSAPAGSAVAGDTVNLYVDGLKVGEATVAEDGSYAVTASSALGAGEHAVMLSMTTPEGDEGSWSQVLPVQIDVAAWAPTIDAAGAIDLAEGADDAIVLQGAAEPGSAIVVTLDDGSNDPLTVMTQTSNDGQWTLEGSDVDTSGLASGPITITATSTDVAGNASSIQHTVDYASPLATAPGADVSTDEVPILTMPADAEVSMDYIHKQEIVFVDAGVSEADALLAGMADHVEVFHLDADRDGVEQMAAIMAERSGVDAVHIVSHGESGELALGNATLDAASVDGAHADALATIGAAMAADGDLLVYGCDFSSGDGVATAEALADATGADVAASDDATGHESLGGDWDLETEIGSIETDNPFTASAVHEWADLLSLETDGDASLGELTDKLEGDGISIANLSVTVGESNQYGTFTGGTDGALDGDPTIGIEDGVVLTTGTGDGIDGIAGANQGAGDETAQLKDYDSVNSVFNDDDRFAATDAIGGSNAAGDGLIIEFDATVTGDTLGANFVFASEEYPEWVDQGFNDAFVFLVSGPGLDGDVNIATVPDSGEAITINSVNADTNSDYYVDNRGDGAHAPFDGWTVPITGEVDVEPNQTYHVKMILADYGDTRFDSAVFIDHFFSAQTENDGGGAGEPSLPSEPIADFSYAPDLDAASDTGASSTDNITRDDTPTFSAPPGTATPGEVINLYVDGLKAGEAIVGEDGSYSVTTSDALGAGEHAVMLSITSTDGVEGSWSTVLPVTVDAAAWAPTVESAALEPSEAGVLFEGTAEPGSAIVITLDDGTTDPISVMAQASGDGAWQVLDGDADVGALTGEVVVTVIATDVAGNRAETQQTIAIETPSPDHDATQEYGASGDILVAADLGSGEAEPESVTQPAVVFVDQSMTDAESLMAEMESTGVQIVHLDPAVDGVQQMADYLASRSHVSALHILSAGGEESLSLGSTILDADSINGDHADALKTIRDAMADDANLYVHGSHFGQGGGTAAGASLAEATGLDLFWPTL